MLGTVPHDHHRLRRMALNPFFSRRSVLQLEPMIRSLVEKLCARLEGFKQSGEPVNLKYAYAALTMDVITEYSFADNTGSLDQEDFSPNWADVVDSVSEQSALNKQYGWLLPLMKMSPIWVVEKMNPQMMSMINWQIVSQTLFSFVAMI